MIGRIRLAALLVGGVVALDIYTKNWATSYLAAGSTARGILGVPLTLAFNPGVAFGLQLPSAGRWMIIIATIAVLTVLSRMFVLAASRDWVRLLAVQLVAAGAIGNLIDRLRWANGVVDFIGPFGFRSMQFPIFNVADMAITTGAILLALSLLREDAEQSAMQVHEQEITLDIDEATT